MMKIYILYLFLILFIIPVLFTNQLKIENFANSEKEFVLKRDNSDYQFKFNNDEIEIHPSNKSDRVRDIYFFYTSCPNKKIGQYFKFNDIDSQNYKLIYNKNTFDLNLTVSDTPLKINVNNFDKTYEFEKASSGNTENKNSKTLVYNIIYFKKPIGNIKIFKVKNKTKEIILKTNNKDIYNNVDYVTAIFTGFLIFDEIDNLNIVDYDNFYKPK